jgi:hypothetical protein
MTIAFGCRDSPTSPLFRGPEGHPCAQVDTTAWSIPIVSIRPRPAHGVNGHLFLPIRGHHFSPLVAIISPHWRPSNLPTIRAAGA